MNNIVLPDTPRQLRLALALRLGVGAVAIGILAGGIAYLAASYEAELRVKELAIAGVRHFESPAMRLAGGQDSPEHQELTRLLGEELVGMRVFAADKRVLFEAWAGLPETALASLRNAVLPLPKQGQSHSRSFRVGSDELIQVLLPMATENNRLIGYVEGISRISEKEIETRRRSIRHVVLATSLSVPAAVLLLYPLMLAMLRRSNVLSRQLLDANLSLIRSLGNAIAKRDADTDAHNYRVTLFSVAIAETLNVPTETISSLVLGAFLHDVGKIGIPDRILLKPGKLDQDEFKVMQNHAVLGVEIVAGNPWLTGAEQTIRHHHERFDGGGYPDGLSGTNIPLAARIFAVADVFDALTSVRPYKEAISLEETLSIMGRESGTHFDPEIFATFLELASDLYEKSCTWKSEQWAAELSLVIKRYFKTETAPERAASRSDTCCKSVD
jgi:HD-GYP domain-containing protein (c-di-GMP phosphodiesterase class II)